MLFIVTGGAGFIGCNTVHRLLGQGHEVVVLDNLSRPGSAENLAWLKAEYRDLPYECLDIRDYTRVKEVLQQYAQAEVILHFAAQVAVTTSVANPREDFEINALGTLNLLEAVRELELDPVFLYTSTNKVYGGMETVRVQKTGDRYGYADLSQGISESMPVDFHSPYGCSKGAADQYVRDYHRIYGLRSVVFRQSCIYGPRQFGIEDQGWVAWFMIAAALGKNITIYGDGCQVRDILYVDDLTAAYERAIDRIEVTQGQIYNIGGGMDNTIAVWSEFGPLLESKLGCRIPVAHEDWRPGDQKVFISDISKAKRDLNWEPMVGIEEGMERLYQWIKGNPHLFR